MRSLLSQMDVPTRTSYVMAVVTPAERRAAASLTAVPRSLAAAREPEPRRLDAGQLQLRLAAAARRCPEDRYDLTLLVQFRHVRPPEEQR